jgi:FimV C-terminal domain
MQTWGWAAGGGAIVLLILLAMLGRRKQAAAASVASSSSSLADRFSAAPSAGKDLVGSDDVDQEELLDQLAEHPDDIYLHLELVTLYYSRRDVEHFEAAAEAMHAHITDPQQDEWQDVVHMGEDLVPGHPLFDHHPELPVHEDAEARREFDIDDYANKSDAPTVVSSMPPLPPGAPKKVSEYNFNFDLTKPAVAESPTDHRSSSDDTTVVAPVAADKHASGDHAAATTAEAASDWHFDEADSARQAGDAGHDLGEFNDDPIDTKLDLARAYLDMGDADGARAMLGEVMKEGSQMQRDVAKRLLDDLH